MPRSARRQVRIGKKVGSITQRWRKNSCGIFNKCSFSISDLPYNSFILTRLLSTLQLLLLWMDIWWHTQLILHARWSDLIKETCRMFRMKYFLLSPSPSVYFPLHSQFRAIIHYQNLLNRGEIGCNGKNQPDNQSRSNLKLFHASWTEPKRCEKAKCIVLITRKRTRGKDISTFSN